MVFGSIPFVEKNEEKLIFEFGKKWRRSLFLLVNLFKNPIEIKRSLTQLQPLWLLLFPSNLLVLALWYPKRLLLFRADYDTFFFFFYTIIKMVHKY